MTYAPDPASSGRIGLFHQLPEAAGGLVVGRQVAVDAFVEALARHATRHRYDLFSPGLQAGILRERMAAVAGQAVVQGAVAVHDQRVLAQQDEDFAFTAWLDTQFDTYRPFAIRGRARRPFPITVVHHTLSYKELLHDRFLRLLLSDTHPYDALVCTSTAAQKAVSLLLEHVESSFNQAYGTELAYGGRLAVIPLGVDTERFQPRDQAAARAAFQLEAGAFVLLWVGRLSAIDKADLMPLILAFSELVRANPGQALLLVCAGTEHRAERFAAHLHEWAGVLGVGPQVRVLTDLQDVHGLYAAADVFVSPVDNLQESFGITPIEAMASGVPQVVSDWNGYRDTVRHGETGFLVPTYGSASDGDLAEDALCSDSPSDHLALAQSVAVDVEALQRAIQTLIDHRDLRLTMAAQSRKRAEQVFAWDVVIGQYEALWEELAARCRHTPVPTKPPPRYTRPIYTRAFGHYPSRMLSDEDAVVLSAAGWRLVRGEVGLPLVYDEAWGGVQAELLQRVLRGVVHAAERGESVTLGRLADVIARKPESTHARDAVFRHALWLLKYGFIRQPSAA